jgi:hypothetical protein
VIRADRLRLRNWWESDGNAFGLLNAVFEGTQDLGGLPGSHRERCEIRPLRGSLRGARFLQVGHALRGLPDDCEAAIHSITDNYDGRVVGHRGGGCDSWSR